MVVAALALAVAVAAWRRAPSYAGDPDALPEDVVGLRQEVAALRAEAAGAFRHLGIVRYDAFAGGGGGRQCRRAAVVVGRPARRLRHRGGADRDPRPQRGPELRQEHHASGRSEQPLSPEEEQAVGSARG